MFVSDLTLDNYKAFYKHPKVHLSPSVTLLLGRNNTGKSSFLRALSLELPDGRHEGRANVPRPGVFLDSEPRFQFTFSVTRGEALDVRTGLPEYSLLLPRTSIQGSMPVSIHERAFGGDISFECTRRNGQGPQVLVAPSYAAPIPGALQELARVKAMTLANYRYNPNEARSFDYVGADHIDWPQIPGKEFGHSMFEQLQKRVFRFAAERRPQRRMKIRKQRELASDASNLVAVLDTLTSERARFAEYEGYVKRVLPEIGEIRVQGTDTEGEKEIRIAMQETVDRTDLTFDLDQVGSGTHQVLALVHAVTMSEQPRLILIDELSTFLHPGATRELLHLITRFPQHQYVIASHGTTALDVLPNARLLLLERGSSGEASVTEVDKRDVDAQRTLLQSLGSSLQDVFGADHVVWVEGPTEASLYKQLLNKVPNLPRGVSIVPIVNVGDLSKRSDSAWAQIYERLSTSGALIPAHVAFILDREDRDEKACHELRTRTSNAVVFLEDAVMTENLFLDARLISSLLKELRPQWDPDTTSTRSLEPDDIKAYWSTLNEPSRYKTRVEREVAADEWRKVVHAAHVLADTFSEFTDNRLEYDKIRHGTRLAQLAFEQSPDLLAPAIATLERALETAASRGAPLA
jgi:energy-coupling factor transporter ATP-binding protein EcfA2